MQEKNLENFFKFFSVLFTISECFVLFFHVCSFTLFNVGCINNKKRLYTSFMSATVTYIGVRLTQLQEKETKGPFMVHWHTLVFLFHSQQKSLHSLYNRGHLVEQTDYALLAPNILSSRCFVSVYERHIVYARDNTNM